MYFMLHLNGVPGGANRGKLEEGMQAKCLLALVAHEACLLLHRKFAGSEAT